MSEICIYVQSKYAKKAYAVESYNVRAWPGMELIKDVLVRAGYEINYAGMDTVQDYKIVLMSITSPIDWFSFISERTRWKPGKYMVIVGGAGNLNIRPVLPFADIFVFGRAENFIEELVKETIAGNKYDHPSVCYSSEFNINSTYEIAQTDHCYPHTVTLANNKKWIEAATGCQKKCLFCGYTWQRKHIGGNQSESGVGRTLWKTATEYTIFDFAGKPPDPKLWFGGNNVPSVLIVGLDGSSERLRFMVNKPITDAMLIDFLVGIQIIGGGYRVKLYNILGYPTETDQDLESLVETFRVADSKMPPIKGGMVENWKDSLNVQVQLTPFKPMPASPAAVWPMSYRDYRSALHQRDVAQNTMIYSGQRARYRTSGQIESLPTIVLWALMIRGIEDDTEIVRLLSTSKKFQNANGRQRKLTLEKYLDIDRLFGSYTWEDLPTRYLKTYVSNAGMAKLSKRAGSFGGQP